MKTFLFLDKEGLIKYKNKNNILILCLSNNNKKDYFIKSVVIRNTIVDFNSFEKKAITSKYLDVEDYDLLIWIQFSELTLRGIHLLNK